MAWVRQVNNGRWQGQFRHSGKVRSVRTFDRKGDARKAAESAERKVALGKWIDPDLSATAFSEFAEQVMAARINIKPSTAARDAHYVKHYVLPTFAGRALGSITRQDIQKWVSDLSTRLAPRTVKHAAQLLKTIMDEAVESKLITQSPYRKIKLPRFEDKERRFLSVEELELLADNISDHWRVSVLVGGYMGLRWGELFGLRRSDFNQVKAQLRVAGGLQRDLRGVCAYLAETKTAAGRRTLSMPKFLVDLVAAHLASHDSEWMFPGRHGTHLRSAQGFAKTFQRAVQSAGIEHCTPHSLRHTAAALMINLGANPVSVQRRLGHTDIRTTLGTYGHLFPEQDERLTEALEQARAAGVQQMCSRETLKLLDTATS